MFYRCTTLSFSDFLWCLLGFMSGFLMLPLQGCSKIRASHCFRNTVITGLLFFQSAGVALWFPSASPSCMSLLAAFPGFPAYIRLPPVRRYVVETKAMVAPVRQLFNVNLAGNLPGFGVADHNQLQGPRFLQQEIRPSGTSCGSLG